MIKNNPMKKEEARQKVSIKLKGRTTTPGNLFKKGNPSGGHRGKKHSELTKMRHSLRMKGVKCSEKAKEINRSRLIKNNPMRDPEVIKRRREKSKIRKKEQANQKRRMSALTNPNIRKNWFKKKDSLNKKEVKHE